MTEDQLEQENLNLLADAGHTSVYGPDIAVDGTRPECSNYIYTQLEESML